MNYQPNILASALASKKTALFATLLPQPRSEDGYWNKPMVGVLRRLSELRQYSIRIESFTFSQTDPGDFQAAAEKVLALKPDGVVFAPFFKKESLPFIEVLKKENIPFVFIDSEIKDAGQLGYIGQNSYQSGKVSGKLLDLMLPDGNILVLHFAKEMDNQNHLVLREKGFYDWFRSKKESNHRLFTKEISDTDSEIWMENIADFIRTNNIKGIFVTNSKVYFAGRLVEKYQLHHLKLIGHDLLKENLQYLENGVVEFLICQRPEEQGYNAINKLFRHVVQRRKTEMENYTSIDIITRENVMYYKEFK